MSDYMMYKAARFISRALPLPYSYARWDGAFPISATSSTIKAGAA